MSSSERLRYFPWLTVYASLLIIEFCFDTVLRSNLGDENSDVGPY